MTESTRTGSFPGDRQQPTAQLPQLLSQDVVFTGGRAAGRSAVAGHTRGGRKAQGILESHHHKTFEYYRKIEFGINGP